MKKIYLIFTFILLLLIPKITATTGHMKLLAVVDPVNEKGAIADLYLTIKEGEGRVFLDTSPLTKIDTQMSTRIAKEIACDFLEFDCEQKDFFYTIRSISPIIGGQPLLENGVLICEVEYESKPLISIIINE